MYLILADYPGESYLEPCIASIAQFDGEARVKVWPLSPGPVPSTEKAAIAHFNRRVRQSLLETKAETITLVYKLFIYRSRLAATMRLCPFGQLLVGAPPHASLVNDAYGALCSALKRPVYDHRTGIPFSVNRDTALSVLEEHPEVDFVQAYHTITTNPQNIVEPLSSVVIETWANCLGSEEHRTRVLNQMRFAHLVLYDWRAYSPAFLELLARLALC